MARTYHVTAPSRLSVAGAPLELGYPATKRGVGGPQAATTGQPGADVGAAINTLLGDVLGLGQVTLGLAILAVGVLVVVSQTSAGAAIGGAAAKGAASGVRRGLRLIPGVGAIV